MPAIWATAISGMAAKFSARPANVTREKRRGADRHQGGLGGDRRGKNRGGRREHDEASGGWSRVSMTTRMRGGRTEGEEERGIDDRERLGGDEQRGGDGECVRGRTAEIDRASGEIDDRHQRGARDRRAPFDDMGVSDEADNRRQHRGHPKVAGKPERRERQAGQDGDVASGDGDDVVRPRLLQPPLHLVVQSGAIADHDGRDDCG